MARGMVWERPSWSVSANLLTVDPLSGPWRGMYSALWEAQAEPGGTARSAVLAERA